MATEQKHPTYLHDPCGLKNSNNERRSSHLSSLLKYAIIAPISQKRPLQYLELKLEYACMFRRARSNNCTWKIIIKYTHRNLIPYSSLYRLATQWFCCGCYSLISANFAVKIYVVTLNYSFSYYLSDGTG